MNAEKTMTANAPPAVLSDEQLFEQVQARNIPAFNELYRRYNKKVFAYCLAILRDTPTTQDAFQQIMMNVFDHREKFQGGNLEAWIFTIARNQCLKVKRDTKQHLHIDDVSETLEDPSVAHEDFLQTEVVNKAVFDLPQMYREIIELRFFADMSYEEIARILEIDINVVKVRLFRAKKELSQRLHRNLHY